MPTVDREAVLEGWNVLLTDHDMPDTAAFHETCYTTVVIDGVKVRNLDGREKAAVDKDPLTGKVFPGLEAEAELDAKDPEYLLKKWVYREARKRVWATTNPLGGTLATMMDERSVNAVICRYGGLRGNAVYITDSAECFKKDVLDSRGQQDVDRMGKVASFYGGTSKRLPGMAPVIADAFDSWMEEMVAVGRSHLPLLLARHSGQGNGSSQSAAE